MDRTDPTAGRALTVGAAAPVRFTDEELLLFGAEHPVVDLPYLGTLDAGARHVAVQVAYRSLCCHGAVPVDHGSGLEVPDSAVSLLRARAAAATVLVVGRATPETGVLRYHHLGHDGVVVEDVTDDGTHALHRIERTDLAADLREFCATEGVVEGRGQPITVTEQAFAAGEHADQLWGDGIAQFDATVWRSGSGVADADADTTTSTAAVVFVLGTRGSWWGHRDDASDEPAVDLMPIAPSAVAPTILAELLPAIRLDEPDAEWPLIRA